MSIAAAALALDREVEWNGCVYTLRPLDYEGQARLSAWVEGRARSGMFRANDDDGIGAQQLLSAFLDNISGGHYEPGGTAFDEACRSPLGGRKVLELMLVAPGDVTDAARWRVETSWDLYANEEFFREALTVAGQLNSDPKARAARRRPARRETPSP